MNTDKKEIDIQKNKERNIQTLEKDIQSRKEIDTQRKSDEKKKIYRQKRKRYTAT